MAKSDDHSIERTREEADRLLEELNRKPPSQAAGSGFSSPVSGPQVKPPQRKAPSAVPMTWLVLAALGFGAMLSALFMAFLFKTSERFKGNGGTPGPVSVSSSGPKTVSNLPELSSATPVQPQPSREVPSKGYNPEFQKPSVPSAGAWGPAPDYKFGRLPDSTFPDSCAFSRTDPAGQTITSRADVDYWACRDEGGSVTDGFTVVWVDGKRTKYTFGPAGTGSVVGTSGETYPMKWQNDRRNDSNVIIITHSDGATSWIPGKVN